MPENNQEVIKTFVEEMMKEKGVEDAALQAQLEEKLGEQVDQAVLRTLPDEKLDELEELLDRDASDDELEKLFDESGVDFLAAAEATMVAFREAFLGNADKTPAEVKTDAE